MNISRQVAIAGIGEADPRPVPGRTSLELNAIATRAALADAGLRKEDVDGVLTAYSLIEPYGMYSSVYCEYIGIQPRYNAQLTVGGATPCILVGHAAAAVAAGLADTVLVTWGDNRASGASRDAIVSKVVDMAGHPQFEHPYGVLIASLYALMARRHMHEYGTTPEQLAEVAVTFRRHAGLNPNALMRQPIATADVLNSKMIATPLHLLDCCLVSDFGGSLIVTSAERARDLKQKPVYILGIGEGHTHEHISQAPTLVSSGAKRSGELAFSMAGLTPADVDVAELYDCFTITVLIELEDLGFVKKGEAGAFVESGAIGLGGKLPVNTYGGMLSAVNGGIFHIIEAVRQVRGEAGPRQVAGAKIALAHNEGGILSTNGTLILGVD